MKQQETGSVMSLSFVDVLANSFASLLVLFFIMVALRGTLDWSQGKSTIGGSDDGTNEPKSPFLVLVKLKTEPTQGVGGKNPYPWKKDNDNRHVYPWLTVNDPKGLFNSPTWSVGADYAVLYSDRPPPAKAILRLQLEPGHPAGTIQVYEGDRAPKPREQKFAADAGSVEVVRMNSGGER